MKRTIDVNAARLRDAVTMAKAVVAGFDYDPGHSDLDNEQPITVRMTLGDYRRARWIALEDDAK